ncbi:MAG: metal transporter ATP-binding protein [Pseudonocardiales bacterium]|nr:metal transporter ATP-binding protein [Pseudonocardiales bacterium]
MNDLNGPGGGIETSAIDQPAIDLMGAGIRLGRRWIWRGVDLQIPVGSFTAVLGPNGAGKTTLMRAALGLLELSEGSIHVLGQTPHEAAAHVGYLPQRRTFDASVPVRAVDVVRLGLDGARWGVPMRFGERARQTRARVDSVLELVGASRYARSPIGRLSGGEQQRVLIAQALVREPRLLLLDEPLDSLDLPNQAAVAGLLRDICEVRGVTVVMVAHDVNPILPYLDQVVYVAGGRVAAGTPERVITTASLSSLYGSPVEVLTTSQGRLVVVGAPDAHTHHAHHGHAHEDHAHQDHAAAHSNEAHSNEAPSNEAPSNEAR